jgi:hypothetical protein
MPVYLESAHQIIKEQGLTPAPTLDIALQSASSQAQALKHYYIGTEHLLLGLIDTSEVTKSIWGKLEITQTQITEAIKFIVGESRSPVTAEELIELTSRSKLIVELGIREHDRLRDPNNRNYDDIDLTLGILREGEGIGYGILHSLGSDLSKYRALVLEHLYQNETPTIAVESDLEAYFQSHLQRLDSLLGNRSIAHKEKFRVVDAIDTILNQNPRKS